MTGDNVKQVLELFERPTGVESPDVADNGFPDPFERLSDDDNKKRDKKMKKKKRSSSMSEASASSKGSEESRGDRKEKSKKKGCKDKDKKKGLRKSSSRHKDDKNRKKTSKKIQDDSLDKKMKSAQFQMFKAMDYQNEFQKVKLAGFLKDLICLAKVSQTRELERRVSKHLSTRDVAPVSNVITKLPHTNDGDIHMDYDLSKALTFQYAHGKIGELLTKKDSDKKYFDSNSMLNLCSAATKRMQSEANVVDLTSFDTVTVVGDLHGSIHCLQQVLSIIDFEDLSTSSSNKRAVVFDGDYVDRGEYSLEVLSILLLLKLAHPKSLFLMRGNHEDTLIASTYGFRDEIDEKYNYDYDKTEQLWKSFGSVFGSLPICAKTKTSIIMHGGIPTEDFSLKELEAIAPSKRHECDSISEPYDDEEDLIRGILWSDPSPDETPGMCPSPRGCGKEFGPDILASFLDRHSVKYLIRAHEPVEDGHTLYDVGGGRGVVTVFSNAAYPYGEGTNMGAVLTLDDSKGTYEAKEFEYKDDREMPSHNRTLGCSFSSSSLSGFGDTDDETTIDGSGGGHHPEYHETMSSFVNQNRCKLKKKFKEIQDKSTKGYVTPAQWAEVISKVTLLPNVPWLDLQPDLAPVSDKMGKVIDWKVFLSRYQKSTIPDVDEIDEEQLEGLQTNKDDCIGMFKLMDTDGNGTIDLQEFLSGMERFNREFLKGKKQIKASKELFESLDLDGSGEISIDEFADALTKTQALRNITDALDNKQIEKLQENHELLLLAFKYLDSDRSGTIDRKEFKTGVDLINKRLTKTNTKPLDADELFTLLDVDKSETLGKQWVVVFCVVSLPA